MSKGRRQRKAGEVERSFASFIATPSGSWVLASFQDAGKACPSGSLGTSSSHEMLPDSGTQADDEMVFRLFATQLARDFDLPPFQCRFNEIPLMLDALRQADSQIVDAGRSTVLPGEFSPFYAQCS